MLSTKRFKRSNLLLIVSTKKYSRREFLEFMGQSAAFAMVSTSLSSRLMAATGPSPSAYKGLLPKQLKIPSDGIELAKGLQWELVSKFGDRIFPDKNEFFGFNNDYVANVAINNDEAYFIVNHESHHRWLTHKGLGVETAEKTDKIFKQSVGFSTIRFKKDAKGRLRPIPGHKDNRRFDALTEIPFSGGKKVLGKTKALGTLANCAGGVTPWGSFLSCEENYHNYTGDYPGAYRREGFEEARYGWPKDENTPPEHYGWVVEVDPKNGSVFKHVSLGRFAHESATVVLASDGRPVVYSGDDKADEFLYKFIGAKKNSLVEGELFVADLTRNKWISLDRKKHKKLQRAFKTQEDVLIYARHAARLLGATPLDRPEDVEVHAGSQDVFVALTNNKKKLNFYGSVLKISPKNADHLSEDFTHDTFVAGGPEQGMCCPDNLAFDARGNMWITTDVSESALGKTPYAFFERNGLYYVPLSGESAGECFHVATAPPDSEFTGPCFSPDGKSIFVSVQHPGSRSKNETELTSSWPEGGNALPKPGLIEIYGETLDALLRA